MADSPQCWRAARGLIVLQSIGLVIAAVIFFVEVRRAHVPAQCGLCGLDAIGKLLTIIGCVLLALVYLTPVVTMTDQPRGQWFMIVLGQATLPIVVFAVHAGAGQWSFDPAFMFLWIPNILIVLAMVCPSTVRFAWRGREPLCPEDERQE